MFGESSDCPAGLKEGIVVLNRFCGSSERIVGFNGCFQMHNLRFISYHFPYVTKGNT